MNTDKTQAFFKTVKARYSGQDFAHVRMLMAMQGVLLLLLVATMILVSFVDLGSRRMYYLLLTAGLALLAVAALALGITGRYKAAALLTVIITISGPWLCFLADSTAVQGNLFPLVFIALSIQLCAILFSERVTMAVSLLQFGGLVILIALSPNLQRIYWPNLMAFVVFSSTLGIVSSILNRRHMDQIEKDRSLLQQSEARLQALAVRDSLTGLFNRRYMEETLEREISRAERESRSLGLIMADVDGFKLINDSFGHVLGDAVLSRVADILNRNVRRSDVACRFGGDEFLLIMPECSLEDAILRAQGLRLLIEKTPFQFDGADMGRVTLSMGVGAMPQHGAISEDLLKAVDKALYDAKRSGRNRVVTVQESTNDAFAQIQLGG